MKGGEKHMNDKQLYPLALYLANAEREREIRYAARARSARRRPQRSVRQSVGRSFVRFGQRLAGEPNLKPIRSR
jgi:hypothetical protein